MSTMSIGETTDTVTGEDVGLCGIMSTFDEYMHEQIPHY